MFGRLKSSFLRGYAQSWRKEVRQTKDKSIAELVQLADEARREWAWYQARAEQAAQHVSDWGIKRDSALRAAETYSALLDGYVLELQRRGPKEG